jgi:AcrR family transcriptional regulator
MTTRDDATTEARTPLSRERILHAALDLADQEGAGALSMRKVGQALGVEAMSLYNHVEHKEDLLNGVVDVIVLEIEAALAAAEEAGTAPEDRGWKARLRHRALTARRVMMRHQWAPPIIQSRKDAGPAMLAYVDAIVGILIDGGLSVDLTHHGLHALGSRILGFSQELFDDTQELSDSPEVAQVMMQQMLAQYPNLSVMLAEMASHDEDSVLGLGCDDQFEFEFALDLTLDGLEHRAARDAATQ